MESLGKLAVLGVGASLVSLGAMAEIKPLDDTALSGVSGQAGLTIEVNNAELSIGELRYQDQGSIAVRDIRLGGANRTNFFGTELLVGGSASDKLDNFALFVDVVDNGSLSIVMGPSGTYNAVDFSLTTGEWVLQSSGGVDGTRLISDLSVEGVGIDVALYVDNLNSHTYVETTFGIDDLDVNFDFLNVRIENMKIAGSDYLERLGRGQPIGIPQMSAEFDFELYSHAEGLGFNINKFETDILMPEIYLGSTPSIGALSMNDVNITAQTVIYGH